MTIDQIRDALMWCTIINFGMLLVPALVLIFARDWVCGMHSRWYGIPVESCKVVFYSAIVFFKTLVIVFNLVPYIALVIVG